MNEKNLIKYYNKFNENKRLTRRHGIVEFTVTMKYIDDYLSKMNNPKILDVGAGCGKYSITLFEKGYDVTAVELVKHNLMTLKKNNPNIKAYQGNAIDLSKFSDNSFELVLLFGPLYHLITKEEKIKALTEAKRVVKQDGIIMVSYIMNEYAVLTYGFKENNILNCIKNNELDKNYHITPSENDLYSYIRLEEIDELNKVVKLSRINIISQDGPTDYIRPIINKMDEETFNTYIKYIISISPRNELLGASSHVLDILKK